MKTLLIQISLFLLLVPFISFSQDHPAMTNKKIISTEKSPSAIGPYNQGIVAGGFLFTSGQLPIHPVTGEVPQTIEEQTIQVLENLKAIIEAAGSNMEKVVKCTVYLQDMSDFATMNKIYATYFSKNPPARATVEVSKMAKNALIEIDAIAFIN
jgi:2-iminobutanoate/2-iminopropanoate deaminase